MKPSTLELFIANMPAIFVSLGTLLVALGTLVSSIRNSVKTTALTEQMGLVSAKVDTTAIKVDEVHTATNGMKDQLVKVTGESEHAKGVIQGTQEEKDRTGSSDTQIGNANA